MMFKNVGAILKTLKDFSSQNCWKSTNECCKNETDKILIQTRLEKAFLWIEDSYLSQKEMVWSDDEFTTTM